MLRGGEPADYFAVEQEALFRMSRPKSGASSPTVQRDLQVLDITSKVDPSASGGAAGSTATTHPKLSSCREA